MITCKIKFAPLEFLCTKRQCLLCSESAFVYSYLCQCCGKHAIIHTHASILLSGKKFYVSSVQHSHSHSLYSLISPDFKIIALLNLTYWFVKTFVCQNLIPISLKRTQFYFSPFLTSINCNPYLYKSQLNRKRIS